MNDKLSLQDLADILSKQTEISKKDAEIFFKELFQVILDNIYQNEIVKIKDFGTFKLTAISSRESVDVNTGEKIEIPAHYRFTFLPDKTLKELVNKPFAQYQSVLLEDGIDPSDINFELTSNNDDDVSDDIEENEVSKLIQEQVKLVNELKAKPATIEEKTSNRLSKNESPQSKPKSSRIELIEKITDKPSATESPNPRITSKPFVYTYSKTREKKDDVIMMTVPKSTTRIPTIGSDKDKSQIDKVEVKSPISRHTTIQTKEFLETLPEDKLPKVENKVDETKEIIDFKEKEPQIDIHEELLVVENNFVDSSDDLKVDEPLEEEIQTVLSNDKDNSLQEDNENIEQVGSLIDIEIPILSLDEEIAEKKEEDLEKTKSQNIIHRPISLRDSTLTSIRERENQAGIRTQKIDPIPKPKADDISIDVDTDFYVGSNDDKTKVDDKKETTSPVSKIDNSVEINTDDIDRPLIPESPKKEKAPIFEPLVVDDDINIDTHFVDLDKSTKVEEQKNNSDDSEDSITDNNYTLYDYQNDLPKKSKLKKTIPIIILLLVIIVIAGYNIFKLFDVKYDYEPYLNLNTNNLTMADTIPYVLEEKDSTSITLVTPDSSVVNSYTDSLAQKNTVIVENIETVKSKDTVTIKEVNNSILITSQPDSATATSNTDNSNSAAKKRISDNLSISITNKAAQFVQKNQNSNNVSIKALIDNQVSSIESNQVAPKSQENSAHNSSVRIKQGMTLRNIAQTHYGNALYWVYIYDANKDKLSNPNTLVEGSTLAIPSLSRYGISDPKDPSQLEKAQRMEHEIVK